MRTKLSMSLQSTLIAIVFLLATVPVAVVATFLVKQFESIQANEQLQKLSAQANNVGQSVQFDLRFFNTRFQHIAQDNVLALAAYTGTFGERARQKMSAIVDEHPLVSAIALIDEESRMLTAVPTQFELQKTPELLPFFSDVLARGKELDGAVYLIDSSLLVEGLRERGITQSVTLNSNYVLVYIAPLVMADSRKSDKFSKITGLIVAFIPAENIYAKLQNNQQGLLLTELSNNGNSLVKNSASLASEIINVESSISIDGMSSDWGANFIRPKNEAFRDVYSLTEKFSWIAVTCMVVLIGLALLISRALLSPLEALNKIVEHYAKRNYTPNYTAIRFTEVQEIVNVLANMANQIQIDHSELEDRVKRRTKDLEQANDELSQAMEQLTMTQDRLVEKEKMSLLGQLVAGIAHEINTPLGICVTAGTTLNEKLDEFQKAYENNAISRKYLEDFLHNFDDGFSIILKNINRAALLMQNFKAIAVDSTSEQKRQFNLYSYIQETLHSLGPELRNYDIHFHIEGEKNLVLESYPGAYAQIITNLVLNSVRHGFENEGKFNIFINFASRDGNLILTYRDDGKGVEPEHLGKLFEPFYTTLSGKGGSGLGLNIVYNIVTNNLKGKVKADCEVGSGLAFNFYIPIAGESSVDFSVTASLGATK